jgi:hypothetical protein
MGEKSSLGDELRDLATDIHAHLVLRTGDASTTYIAELIGRAAQDGRPLVVLYAADFDPGGYTMPPTVARKIQALVLMKYPYLKVQLHRVALTIDQVLHPTGNPDDTAESLPSTILSDGNTRSKQWKATWGREQTEIDALMALHPRRLKAIFREAIRPFFDPSLQRRIDEAKRLPDATTEWVKALPEYQSAVTTITDLHGPAACAADALNEGMERTIEALRTRVRDATDAPTVTEFDIKPEITAIAPAPLFTTDDTFVDATLKMRKEKEWSVTPPKVTRPRRRRRRNATTPWFTDR